MKIEFSEGINSQQQENIRNKIKITIEQIERKYSPLKNKIEPSRIYCQKNKGYNNNGMEKLGDYMPKTKTINIYSVLEREGREKIEDTFCEEYFHCLQSHSQKFKDCISRKRKEVHPKISPSLGKIIQTQQYEEDHLAAKAFIEHILRNKKSDWSIIIDSCIKETFYGEDP